MILLLWTPRSKIPGEFEPGSPEWYRIRIAFHYIDELELDGFNHQNVIEEIAVHPRQDRLKIWVSSTFGAELIFTYKRAEVVSGEGTEYHLPRESPADRTTHIAEIT